MRPLNQASSSLRLPTLQDSIVVLILYSSWHLDVTCTHLLDLTMCHALNGIGPGLMDADDEYLLEHMGEDAMHLGLTRHQLFDGGANISPSASMLSALSREEADNVNELPITQQHLQVSAAAAFVRADIVTEGDCACVCYLAHVGAHDALLCSTPLTAVLSA